MGGYSEELEDVLSQILLVLIQIEKNTRPGIATRVTQETAKGYTFGEDSDTTYDPDKEGL